MESKTESRNNKTEPGHVLFFLLPHIVATEAERTFFNDKNKQLLQCNEAINDMKKGLFNISVTVSMLGSYKLKSVSALLSSFVKGTLSSFGE